MQPRTGLMSGLNTIADWVMKLSVVNIFWFMLNIPIVMIVFFMMISPSLSVVAVWGIPLFFFSILLFFPSTFAVFAIARDWVMKGEVNSLWKIFWGHFISNYKSALVSGSVLTLLWVVWAADGYYFQLQHDIFGVIFTIIGFFLYVYTVIFIALSVHYQMGRRELLKNAFFVTVGSPKLLILIILANVVIVYLSFRFWFVLVFFAMSLCALVTFYLFYRFTLRVKEKIG